MAAVAEVPLASLRRIELGSDAICLARTTDGEFFALADTCSHEEFPLSEGTLAGREVECSLHGSVFDLATGKPNSLPAVKPVRSFGVTVQDGEVYVEV